MKLVKYIPLLALIIVLLGCSFTVNVPSVETGTTQKLEVNVPVPDGVNEANIKIEMGAGKLNLVPGSSGLVDGTIQYNVADWKPAISNTSDGVLISQTHSTNIGIPDGNIRNEWNLKLGSTPMALNISAGAYEGTLDLSGLSITDLEVGDGASKASVHFDSPNPVDMRRLVYKTGASQVDLIGLGNANVDQVTFESGAGSYTLDFTGEIKKDMSVKISSGMSDIKIIVPANVHTLVYINGGLNNINVNGTWTINGTTYECGSGAPTITINIEMAVGNLTLSKK